MDSYCEFSTIHFGQHGKFVVGRITIKQGKLKAEWTKDKYEEENKRAIQAILKQPSYNKSYDPIDPKEDPRKWLESLPYKYSGGTFWCELSEDKQ